MGFRSGEHGGHVMRDFPLMPIDARYAVVAFAECDGALSCIKIILERRNSGKSSSQMIVQKVNVRLDGKFYTFRHSEGSNQFITNDPCPKHNTPHLLAGVETDEGSSHQ